MKKIIGIFLFLCFFSSFAQSGYFFEKEQCACDVGMELKDSTRQGNMLGCAYIMEGSKSFYRPKINIKVRTFVADGDMERAKESVDKYNNDYTSSDSMVVEQYIMEEDRTGVVYHQKNDNMRTGNRTIAYKGNKITIFASEMEIDIRDKLDTLESCMKKAIDDSLEKQEAEESNKLRLNLSVKTIPLEGMRVMQDNVSTITDVKGNVDLRENLEDLEIVFTSIQKNKLVYSLALEEGKTLSLDMEIDNGIIKEMKFAGKKLEIINEKITEFKLEDYNEQLGYYTYNYLYFQDAAQFYTKKGVIFDKPVEVLLNKQFDKKAAYEDYKIILTREMGDPTSAWSPYTHYHEFSHFAMHTMYGDDIWDEIVTSKNHGGFANPTTMDSWAEAFAEFMTVVISNELDHYWADKPSEKVPAYYPVIGSLDTNYLPWQKEGRAEEYAIAGFLYDLRDDKAMHEKGIIGADIAFGLYFKHSDRNEDGIITKEEYALARLRDSGASIEFNYTDWKNMIDYGYDLKDAYDLEADMGIWDKYRGDNNILEYEELIAMGEIMFYEWKDEVVAEWLRVYDENKDGQISEEEGKSLLLGYEVIKKVSQGKEIVELDRMEELAKDTKIQDAYWMLDSQEDATPDEFIEMLKSHAVIEDDDSIVMSFDILWPILKNNHKDFTSFMEQLLEGFNADDPTIANLFLSHGLYADTTEGDGVYEKNLEAFIDENGDRIRQETETFIDYPDNWFVGSTDEYSAPTNYQRPSRQSIYEFPGQRMPGVDMASYIIWEKGNIVNAFAVTTDGYVPVPPNTTVLLQKGEEVVSMTSVGFANDISNMKEIEKAEIKKENTSQKEFSDNNSGGASKYVILFLALLIFMVGLYFLTRNKKN